MSKSSNFSRTADANALERGLKLIHHRVVLHHNAIGSHVGGADLKSLS